MIAARDAAPSLSHLEALRTVLRRLRAGNAAGLRGRSEEGSRFGVRQASFGKAI
jgi:hypothetical protein